MLTSLVKIYVLFIYFNQNILAVYILCAGNTNRLLQKIYNILCVINFQNNYNTEMFGGDITSGPAVDNSLIPISILLNKFNINYEYYNKQSRKSMPRNKFEIAVQFAEDMNYINITSFHGQEQSEFRNAYFTNADLPIQPYYYVNWLINAIRLSRHEILNIREYFCIYNISIMLAVY